MEGSGVMKFRWCEKVFSLIISYLAIDQNWYQEIFSYFSTKTYVVSTH